MTKITARSEPNNTPQRLELSFRHDKKGYWLGQLHVCSDMKLFYTPAPNNSGDWMKGVFIPQEDGSTTAFAITRDDAIHDFDEIVADLRGANLWINPDAAGEEAFRALLLFCWTEFPRFHRESRASAPPPNTH